jgi:phosphonate transport system permease protein
MANLIATDTPAIASRAGEYAAAQAARRRQALLFFGGLLVACALAAWIGEVRPARFVEGLPRLGNYVVGLIPPLRWATLGADLAEWYWGLAKWLRLLLETVLIAYVGTMLGFLGAFALCFSASANLVRSRWIVIAARRTLEFFRTVPELVFALVFVVAFGLGPLPGVLALALHTLGALGKLFAEVNENVDLKPVEGIQAAGGSWVEAMRYAVLPQVAPGFASYALLRFEINVRGAAVLGFVGAGGIGQELLTAIRQFYLTDVSAILLLIIAAVMVTDMLTEALRHRLLHLERRT